MFEDKHSVIIHIAGGREMMNMFINATIEL